MKLLLLTVLLSAAAPSAWATCNPDSDAPGSDVPCAVRSGQCSLSADIFLGAPDDSSAPQYVLEYGKFCGAGRKCPGLNNANEEADGRNIDVDACDGNVIDASCKEHDACLDIAGLPASEPVPPPVRCPCELAFVTKLGAVALDLLPGFFDPPAVELCDDDYYDSSATPVGVSYDQFLSSLPGVVSSEAVLLAAPFCGQFVDIEGNDDSGSCLEAEALALYANTNVYTPVLGVFQADLGLVQGLCGAIINALP